MNGQPYKKKTSQQANILEETHFAVCPYMIQLQTDIDYIFTVNFQKDCQVIGQISRLILPSCKNSKISLQPQKNIMFFRIAKDKQTHYKWTLYRRNQTGKQQIIDIVKVALKDIIANYLKFQLDQKENILKSKGKSQNLHQIQKFLKESKFVKSGVLLRYIFFIGSNQNKLIQAVKSFKLQEKFIILEKTLNAIVPNKEEDSLQKEQNQSQNNMQRQQIKKKKVTDKILHQNQEKDKKSLSFFHLIKKQNTKQQNQTQQYQQKIDKCQLLKQKQITLEQNKIKQRHQTNNAQSEGQIKLEKKGNKLQNKDSFKNLKLQFDDIVNQEQKEMQFQNMNNKKQQSENGDNIKAGNLALTYPSKHIKQSQLSARNIDISGTSFLKLDDIILNDKRISISDKSSWMHTSKSKTDSKENYNSKNKETNYIIQEKQLCNGSDDFILHQKSLQIYPSNLKQNSKKNILKRGTSIDDKKVFDQINISNYKPKTLGQQQIRQSVNQSAYLKLNKDDLQLADKKIDNKYTINIPSMIAQDLELSRSFQPDNFGQNSLSLRKESLSSQQDWGNGIQKIDEKYLQSRDINWIDKRILDIQKYFVPKLKPVIIKIEKNQWTKSKYHKVKPLISTKKIIIIILLLLFFSAFTLFWNIRKPEKQKIEKGKVKQKNFRDRRKKNIISRFLK